MSCFEVIVICASELGVGCAKNYDKHDEGDIAKDEVDQIRIGLIADPISGD